MKIRITFKDPDAVYEAIDDAFEDMKQPIGVSQAEWEVIISNRKRDVLLSPWIECMEYCTVEIDTEDKTATVIPKGTK